METWLKFTIGAVLLFMAIVIIVSLTSNNSAGNIFSNNQPSPSAIGSPIKIFSSDLERDADGNLFIVGIAQNIGNAKLNYSEIDADFYDKAGNLLSKSYDKIQGLDANETWNFKIDYQGVEGYDVGSYNLSVGNYW